MDKINLRLKVIFQYLGPEHGSIPYLRVYYVLPDGTEYYSADFNASSQKKYPEEIYEGVQKSNQLKKYEKKDGIDIGIVHTAGINEPYIASLGIDPLYFKHKSYTEVLKTFADLVSDIYFDFNGNAVGFAGRKNNTPIEIEIDKEIISLKNKMDTQAHRELLSQGIASQLGYIVSDLNAKHANNIAEHTSPRR